LEQELDPPEWTSGFWDNAFNVLKIPVKVGGATAILVPRGVLLQFSDVRKFLDSAVGKGKRCNAVNFALRFVAHQPAENVNSPTLIFFNELVATVMTVLKWGK
jgi:hypothetical protein